MISSMSELRSVVLGAVRLTLVAWIAASVPAGVWGAAPESPKRAQPPAARRPAESAAKKTKPKSARQPAPVADFAAVVEQAKREALAAGVEDDRKATLVLHAGRADAPQDASQPTIAIPTSAEPATPLVPPPDVLRDDAVVPALPELRQSAHAGRKHSHRHTNRVQSNLSDVPYLVGDGCGPAGGGGRASVGRLAIVAQGLDSAGFSPASANLYAMNPATAGSVQAIAPSYPSFDPLAAPTQLLPGSVTGPQSLSFGATTAGITAVGTPNGVYTGAAQTAFENGTSPPLQTAAFANGSAVYDPSTSGALAGAAPGTYDAFLYYNYMVDASVVLPGYAVGVVKLTENMSPIPRDRVYMNYSYFKNADFYNTRADVNRFVPGFEKTFADGWTSIEIRTPFAATLDATQYLSPTADTCGSTGVSQYRDIQFGDMSVIFKTLVWERKTWAITGGVQVLLPTAANGSTYASTAGTPDSALFQSVFVANESVHVMPFVGSVWAPSNRFFNQALLQIDRDCNGNLCYVNPTGNPSLTGRQLTQIGRAFSPTFMYLSFGTGYWLYKNDRANFTGFSPIMELHVNQALNSFQPVTSDSGYVLGVSQGLVSVTNALVGCNFEWGKRSTLTFAYVTPLGGGVDRFFDGELRALYNWRFGRQTRLTRAQF